ncbi:alkaline phosphatase [bacterium]|nr:alkaline phosphatase [bacterium]
MFLRFFFLALLLSCSSDSISSQKNDKPKSIIFMIGDGMGLSQVSYFHLKSNSNQNFAKIKQIGFATTYSSDNLVTDSGASGTALATGEKTKNYAIGVDTLGNSLKTILEYFEEKKLPTGLVVTSSITHATPASFYAHELSRGSEEAIALQLSDKEIEVLVGGGEKFFTQRKDSLNLLEKMQQKGYGIFKTLAEAKGSTSQKVFVPLAADGLPKKNEGRGEILSEGTQLALEKLSKGSKGFFLMVEGSQIDWAGHGNDFVYLLAEMEDFNTAIGVAIDFVDKNPETLLVITGDHETGGLAITSGNHSTNEVNVKFVSTSHTGVLIPVYAYGKGAENFQGFYDNTDIFRKMLDLMGCF